MLEKEETRLASTCFGEGICISCLSWICVGLHFSIKLVAVWVAREKSPWSDCLCGLLEIFLMRYTSVCRLFLTVASEDIYCGTNS